jgi:hypothetical protein
MDGPERPAAVDFFLELLGRAAGLPRDMPDLDFVAVFEAAFFDLRVVILFFRLSRIYSCKLGELTSSDYSTNGLKNLFMHFPDTLS